MPAIERVWKDEIAALRRRSAGMAGGRRARQRAVDPGALRAGVRPARTTANRDPGVHRRRRRPWASRGSCCAARSTSWSGAPTARRCASPTTRPGRTAPASPPSSRAAGCCSRCSTRWRSRPSPASRWRRAGCRTARRPAASPRTPIALDPIIRRRGLEVLEIVDRAIEHGTLAARPGRMGDRSACEYCDFRPVCGRDEARRVKRKPAARRPRRAAEVLVIRRHGRRRRPPADCRGARRHAGRRSRRRHRQDHRAGQAHRPADRDRPGHDSPRSSPSPSPRRPPAS